MKQCFDWCKCYCIVKSFHHLEDRFEVNFYIYQFIRILLPIKIPKTFVWKLKKKNLMALSFFNGLLKNICLKVGISTVNILRWDLCRPIGESSDFYTSNFPFFKLFLVIWSCIPVKRVFGTVSNNKVSLHETIYYQAILIFKLQIRLTRELHQGENWQLWDTSLNKN